MVKKILYFGLILAFLYAVGQVGQADYRSLSSNSVVAVVSTQDSTGCTTVVTPDGEVWCYYDNDDLVRGDRVFITIVDGEVVDSEIIE